LTYKRDLELRKRIVKTMVLSGDMDHDTTSREKIEAFVLSIWRKMLKISSKKAQKVANPEVLDTIHD